MTSRFIHVTYDKECGQKQHELREQFIAIEQKIVDKSATRAQFDDLYTWCEVHFKGSRGQLRGSHALWRAFDFYSAEDIEETLARLEITYMWYGKAIRDEQIAKVP